MEHVGKFLVQCGMVGVNDFLKFRLFVNSLKGQLLPSILIFILILYLLGKSWKINFMHSFIELNLRYQS